MQRVPAAARCLFARVCPSEKRLLLLIILCHRQIKCACTKVETKYSFEKAVQKYVMSIARDTISNVRPRYRIEIKFMTSSTRL